MLLPWMSSAKGLEKQNWCYCGFDISRLPGFSGQQVVANAECKSADVLATVPWHSVSAKVRNTGRFGDRYLIFSFLQKKLPTSVFNIRTEVAEDDLWECTLSTAKKLVSHRYEVGSVVCFVARRGHRGGCITPLDLKRCWHNTWFHWKSSPKCFCTAH